MTSHTKRLHIPAQLRAVVLGSVAAFACSSTTTPSDGGLLSESGRDASFDGGPCKIEVPAGRVCETTCYNISKDPISPYACQVYCAPPDDAGPGGCTCNGGIVPDGGSGSCPGSLECALNATSDGGTRVFC